MKRYIKTKKRYEGSVKTIDRTSVLRARSMQAAAKMRTGIKEQTGQDERNETEYAEGKIATATEPALSRLPGMAASGAERAASAVRNEAEGMAAQTGSEAPLLIREGKTIRKAAPAASKELHSKTVKAEAVKKAAVGRIRRTEQAVRNVKQIAIAVFNAAKTALASARTLISSLIAGGWVSVFIILIFVLFGAAFYFFGDESSSNYIPVSDEVEAYTETIKKYAAEQGIPEYIELIKAVMMQESGGIGSDPMNASDSDFNTKYPNGITDPEYSIECGICKLRSGIEDASVNDPLDMEHIRLALQGYNYGNGYIAWAIERDGGYTLENASVYSDDQAEKLGVEEFRDKLYPAHVLRYYPYGNYNYGIGNTLIVQVASQEIGNVGGEKFWRWYGFTGHVEWCACFVSWCANQCGYIEEGIIPKFSVVDIGVEWFKARNQWQTRDYIPAPGDIIFFDWHGNGEPDHVGFVERVDDQIVCTIEGNSSDRCRRKVYSIYSNYILGYGIPKY